MNLRLLPVALLPLAAGCPPGSYGEFLGQLEGAACDWAESCGQVAPGARDECPAPTILAQLSQSPRDIPGALEAGHLRYVPNGAQACIDAMRGAPCDPAAAAIKLSLACNNVIQPAVPNRNLCWGNGECVGGICVQANGSGCPGVCEPYPSPNQPCDPSGLDPRRTCDPTVHYCGPRDEDPDAGAQETVCKRRKGRGQACSGDQCTFGLVCIGTCEDPPRLGEGDPCFAAGTLCNDDTYCAATSVCERHRDEDEACDAPFACKKGLACIGLATAMDGSVVPGTCRPWLEGGAACAEGAQMTGCPATHSCTGGVCVRRGAILSGPGRPCDAGGCQSGLYCDPGLVCRYVSGIGGKCGEAGGTCSGNLTCDPVEHRCQTPFTCP